MVVNIFMARLCVFNNDKTEIKCKISMKETVFCRGSDKHLPVYKSKT